MRTKVAKKPKLVKVAIQGVAGSYSWMAAKKLAQKKGWRKIKFFYCASFAEAFALLDRQKVTFALLPYRNTIAGKVLPVWKKLKRYRIRERFPLPINHCLAVAKTRPPTHLDQVKYALSHPVALRQCQNFFRKHPWIKPKEYEDTAAAARFVAQAKERKYAAICSAAAAQLFRLTILRRQIQDQKDNQTFFALLEPSRSPNFPSPPK